MILEGESIVRVTEVVVPDGETLPVPVHPVHTNLVPTVPAHGEVTEAVMLAPALNHSLVGVGVSWGDVTAK